MKYTIKFLTFVLLIIALTFMVYYPGLSGGFIFDDFNNLRLIGIINDDLSLKNIIEYLAGQKSGPVGRPITSLSFLLDATNWPPESERPFKLTNLIIHIINSVLLFYLLLRIFLLTKQTSKNAYWLSFVACMLWALHPFMVSTTMYVVQRMAMLPMTFSLLGMILYLNARMLPAGRRVASVVWMVIAVWGGTLLAILSKENGVLLLLYIALFEYFIVKSIADVKLSLSFKLILIYIPILLLIFALIYKFSDHTMYYDLRTYDLGERLLTQSRMIVKYLYYLWVPDYLTEGVFNDGIKASKSILDPISTLLSMVFIGVLLYLAFFYRHKAKWLSFAILFFFAGHLLESTYLPLELYFEHRNYLPTMFMFVPLVLLLLKIKHRPKLFYSIPCIFLALLAVLTLMRSDIWGNNLLLHHQTAYKYPESARAANTTASLFAWDGHYDEALEMLNYGISNHDKLQLKINRIALLCELNRVNRSELDDLISEMNNNDFIKDDLIAFKELLFKLTDAKCFSNYGVEYAQKMLDAFEASQLFSYSATARKYYYFQNATFQANTGVLHMSLYYFKEIIHEVEGLTDDKVFASTAISAIEYLAEFNKDLGKELADYYSSYCTENFDDCNSTFINELSKTKEDIK